MRFAKGPSVMQSSSPLPSPPKPYSVWKIGDAVRLVESRSSSQYLSSVSEVPEKARF